ncbi:MAG: DUF4013 domain-containing protein [Anaerolineales bacterium]
MNNIQETLLFPVRDAEARKHFFVACLVMLAAFFIPILPTFILMGYGVKVMRQIIDERKDPSMPAWQGIDWAETFIDGIKLYGVQLVLMLPLMILMGCGFLSFFGGSVGISALADENTRSLASLGVIFMFIGVAFFMLFSVLSLPYGILLSALAPHVATKRTFSSGFEFKEWLPIFRKALGQFLLAYALTFVVSFAFVIVMQIAMITIVLMCIVPLIMIPYSVYSLLMMNALFAQAYLAGRDALEAETPKEIVEAA